MNIYSLFNYYLIVLSLQRVVCAINVTLFTQSALQSSNRTTHFCDNSRVGGVDSLHCLVVYAKHESLPLN